MEMAPPIVLFLRFSIAENVQFLSKHTPARFDEADDAFVRRLIALDAARRYN
jgi:hypothetical protein